MNYSMGCCTARNKYYGINGRTGNNAFVIVYTATKLNAKKELLKKCIIRNKVKNTFKAVVVDKP